MTEEVKLELAPEPQAEEVKDAAVDSPAVQADAPAPNPVEAQALEQGWRPKEEWVASGGDPDEWKPAKLFLKDGELYKSLHSIKREQRQTQAALEALKGHHKMVYEKAYTQAIQDLRMAKRQAIREGDIETLEKVEDKMDQLKEEYARDTTQLRAAEAQAQQVGSAPVEFQAFLDRNPWYTSDKALKVTADGIGLDYLGSGGSRDGLLSHVEKEIKRMFPEKFGASRKAAPNAVAPVTKSAAPRRERIDADLSESERQVMNTFVNMGVMTKEQYISELKGKKANG